MVVADINPAEGEQCVEGIRSAGGEAWYVKVDVSTESDVAAMADDADRLMGGIDATVSAAGIARTRWCRSTSCRPRTGRGPSR